MLHEERQGGRLDRDQGGIQPDSPSGRTFGYFMKAIPKQPARAGRQEFLRIVTGSLSDPGIKRRDRPNEDSLLVRQGAHPGPGGAQSDHWGLFVVADGMGGHTNGQRASGLAIEELEKHIAPALTPPLRQRPEQELLALLGDGVRQANLAVYQANREELVDMGTTVTAVLIVGGTAYVANVGDSRTYLYRETEGLRKITRDHSIVETLLEAGVITVEEIYTHPKRNQIFRCLGEKAHLEVDTYVCPLQRGDRLLLCSDGLWELVRDARLGDVVGASSIHPARAVKLLVQSALDAGGPDNISVILVELQ